MSTNIQPEHLTKRLSSLDFMRGFIMVLLALESTGLYNVLFENTAGTSLGTFFIQFHHHPWNGLRFWDLIQPGFMFIAGIAMAYSVTSMREKNQSSAVINRKMFKRCGWLFFWGVLNYAVRKNGLSFELWNVLTQLSFTLLLSYLIFDWKSSRQIIFSLFLLLLTEILYRFTSITGYDQPFTDQQNIGNYIDLLLMNKINGGGWVAINCIPTSVHTIAGALVGKLLLSKSISKVNRMIYWGLGCLLVGYALDFMNITPIIKRIATSSFTIVSLGWCLLFFGTAYYLIEIKNRKKNLFFFEVVGMNSIFIYLFFEIVGDRWFNGYIGSITNGLMGLIHIPLILQSIITCLCIFMMEWYLCLFLFRKKIFFRL